MIRPVAAVGRSDGLWLILRCEADHRGQVTRLSAEAFDREIVAEFGNLARTISEAPAGWGITFISEGGVRSPPREAHWVPRKQIPWHPLMLFATVNVDGQWKDVVWKVAQRPDSLTCLVAVPLRSIADVQPVSVDVDGARFVTALHEARRFSFHFSNVPIAAGSASLATVYID